MSREPGTTKHEPRATSHESRTTDRVPVLLDTDIGSDIDDAVCLAYLLRQERCELLGVTTVSGRPRQRAALADALCRAAGRADVPIHSGADQGILLGVVQPECPQAAALSRFAHKRPEDFEPYTAVEFLRRRIRARPGEITLLSIGPLTNLGLLFSLDPEIPALLKRLVMMCGVFTRSVRGAPVREWNALCDPLATAAAYRAAAHEHVSIGLDVTLLCRKSAQECVQRFREIGGPLEVVAAMAAVHAAKHPAIVFHDPLAAAVVFEPGLCEYQSGLVEVETRSARVAGMTQFNPRAEFQPHRVAVKVKADEFLRHYFEVVTG